MNPMIRKVLGVGLGTTLVVGSVLVAFDNQGVKELLTSKLGAYTQANDKLTTQKKTLLDRVGELDGNITTLKGQKEQLLAQIEELKASGGEATQEIARLQAKIVELEGKIATLEEEKLALQKQITNLETQNTDLAKALEDQQAETTKANDYIKELKAQLDGVNVSEVEELPTFVDHGDLGSVEGGGEVTPPQADNIWDIAKTNTFTYDGATFERIVNGGQVYFKVTKSNDNISTIKMTYLDPNDDKRTKQFIANGSNELIPNPPHTYVDIVIGYQDTTTKTITFGEHDFSNDPLK